MLPAAKARAEDLRAQVVDVGAGLCVVIDLPGAGLLVYDAGIPGGSRCGDAIDELAVHESGKGTQSIELLVLSHMDSDHVGEAAEIILNRDVRRILHTGFRRHEAPIEWPDAVKDLFFALEFSGARVLDLSESDVIPGSALPLGDAEIEFIAGWSEVDPEWGVQGDADQRNSVSIVIRVVYGRHSILLAGDTYGRHGADDPDGGDPDACDGPEQIMVDRVGDPRRPDVRIDSDVLIAAHHGANDASATCFIEAVSPSHVVFSAGNSHGHPRAATADRFIATGIPVENIYRTDWGARVEASEWTEGSGSRDSPGDDHVWITITEDRELVVHQPSR